MSRFLGVDYGTKRVGLAISDGLGLTARPLEVVPSAEAVDRIVAVAAEHDAHTIVVGLPTGLSGAEGASAEGARALGEELSAAGLTVDGRGRSAGVGHETAEPA